MKVTIKPNGRGKNAKMINRVAISNEDTWSLDYTLAKVILPALKKYKKVGASKVTWGCVIDYTIEKPTPEQRKKERAKMMRILNAMIYSFEKIANDDYFSLDKKEMKKVQKGLDLFAKYYMALWW